MTATTPPLDRTLDCHEVIEEEYAHLHPGAAPVPNAMRFTADQVRDAGSLARIFCETLQEEASAWERSPVRNTALVVLGSEPKLRATAERLHDAILIMAPAQKLELAFVGHLIDRLNALVEGPLLGGPAFSPLYPAAGVTASDDSSAERRRRANRLLLEFAFSPAIRRLRDVRLAAVYENIRRMRQTAICLSGGGIRSATFALGVLTGLARHKLLGKFDYISTVSGGGYIGSWLSAWMKHEGAPAVQSQLGAMTGEKLQPDPEPVRHLRSYASYLTPKLGALSADTWTLLATIIRNLLLNWIVVVPLLLSALLVPRLAVSVLRFSVRKAYVVWPFNVSVRTEYFDCVLYAVGFLLGMAAISYVHRNRARVSASPLSLAERTQGVFLKRCLLPLSIAAAALTFAWWAPHMMQETRVGQIRGLLAPLVTLKWFAVVGLVMHVLGWFAGIRHLKRKGGEIAVVAATGALAGVMSAQLVHLVEALARNKFLIEAAGDLALSDPSQGILTPRLYVTLAVPAFLALIMVGSQLFIGLTSQFTSDEEREWSARFNAWLFIVIVSWVMLNIIVLIVPPLIEHAWDGRSGWLYGIGGTSGLITLLLGRSAATPANSTSARAASSKGPKEVAKGVLMSAAAPIFAVSLISLLSVVNGQLVLRGACDVTRWCGSEYHEQLANPASAVHLHPADFTPPHIIALVMLVLAAAGLGLGRLIDTNQFSLHAMYRNRLTRAYLRASRPRDKRAADPFTGFDRGDDLPMGTLWPAVRKVDECERDRDERMPPLHVVNQTLNLVSGRALAWQQRKAASFGVTALHAGSAFVGYRRTSLPATSEPASAGAELYGGPDGVSLGTAVTISGAAASPDMGYHSSPAITFLLALFNARLGWWLGNPGAPGDKTFHRPCPPVGVLSLAREAFGLTTDRSDFVFLSDGGHFENLALYEMVLRRCRFILVSDGGCDPTATFADLGNALRKIRIDLGVPIEFPAKLRILSRDATPRADGIYWAVGTIRYSHIDRPAGDASADEDFDGVLLYVKPAIYGREPADVGNYAAMSPTFPHETTADQFFNESQFESYRALGSYIVDEMVGQLSATVPPGGNPRASSPLGWLRAR